MNNIELYINNRLCEIANAEKLGIRLNRILIKPAELNTKDAQYSYSITIPSTNINDEIFGFANVEEVKDKFNHDYNALLYVDAVLVFDGKFRMSEIDKDGNFKGNLLIPAKKTIKELFGDTKMNELKTTWSIDFKEMVSSLNKWNTKSGTPDCIFPYVLYGLLPKVPKDANGNYSAKDVWDETVRLGIEDFPPSINCLQTIKKIFETLKDKEGKPQNIGGTAFDDVRLKNLYMSYSNPTDYAQEWNWGDLGTMSVSGNYKSIRDYQTDDPIFERSISQSSMERDHFYTVNLFNSHNVEFSEIQDTGTNMTYYKEPDERNPRYIKKNLRIRIPASGLYKVKLYSDVLLYRGGENESRYDKHTDRTWANTRTGRDSKYNNYFGMKRYEIQVVRDFGSGDFGFDNKLIAGFYDKPNLPQNDKTGTDEPENYPKWYPQEYCPMIVDPSSDNKLINGLHFGQTDRSGTNDRNPEGKPFNTLFIKNGYSWDRTFSQDKKICSAYYNPYKYHYHGYVSEELESDDDYDVVIGKEFRDKFKTDIQDIPISDISYISSADNNITGEGQASSIIWLDKGECVTVCWVSEAGDLRKAGHSVKRAVGPVIVEDLNFRLSIEPFRTDEEWVTINKDGEGTASMNWTDIPNFQKGEINLMKFLPSEQKVDEWLDNFCKAFNLQLNQIDNDTFELNIKQQHVNTHIASVLDLDNKAGIIKRSNQPLGLPAVFDIGFKINEEEKGFIDTKDNGGGKIETGSLDGSSINQTSNFSYNWFKTITQTDKDGNLIQQLQIPIISNKEVWVGNSTDYKEMVKKTYTNYAQRFWYRNENILYNLGAVWKTNTIFTDGDKSQNLLVSQLADSLKNKSPLTLSYKNEPNSILQTYFNVIAPNDSNYTDIECYLSPDEYDQLNGAKLVKLNNDLYYVAAIEGYDPLGRNKTKLRLIRKM